MAIPLSFLVTGGIQAEPRFRLDGWTNDWDANPATRFEDPTGDENIEGRGDITSVEIGSDARTLFIKIEYAEPYPLEDPRITVYFDLDQDPGTGFSYIDMGIDASYDLSADSGNWSLGEDLSLRRGTFLVGSRYEPQNGIYELAFPLTLLPEARWGGGVGIAVYSRDSLDRAPGFLDSGLVHRFTRPVRKTDPAGTFAKRKEEDLRILSWNVLRDAPLNEGAESRFGRVVAALKPDIVCFQELYTANTLWVIDFMNKWVPLEEGEGFWFAVKENDCITASRFPVDEFSSVDRNLITEIDTTKLLGQKSWILNAHTPCCDNEEGRIEETDNFMKRLRERKEAARRNQEPPFAIFLVGDMNTGGSEREVITMIEGNISDDFRDGPDFDPDWDRSALTDLAPLHSHGRRIDTWRSLNNRSNTSRLDYIYYSDSQVIPTRSFVLNTRLVPDEFLEEHGLTFADTDSADHLPVVGDFRATEDPFPGVDQQADGSGWLESTWLGDLYWLNQPRYYHTGLGWLHENQGPDDSSVWIFLYERDAWAWTSSQVYPWFFLPAEEGWEKIG